MILIITIPNHEHGIDSTYSCLDEATNCHKLTILPLEGKQACHTSKTNASKISTSFKRTEFKGQRCFFQFPFPVTGDSLLIIPILPSS